jgi:thymidylate kinase
VARAGANDNRSVVPLVLVVGISGAGKTTVCGELKNRGFVARDADYDGFSCWRNKTTGEVVAVRARDEVFLHEHDWVIDVDKVAALVELVGDQTAYLCGSAANEDEIWRFASKVICLAIDDETLRYRLRTRTTNDFGKSGYELAACLERNTTKATDNAAKGAVLIDATQPLATVVDEVLRITGTA